MKHTASARRVAGFLGLVLTSILFTSCQRQASSPDRAGNSASTNDAEPPKANSFVGSARCAECHPQEAERWSRSWHSRALSPALPESVVGRFDGAHFKGASSEAWTGRDDKTYVMRTADRSGTLHDYSVPWVIGGKRMQDAVAVMDDGAWQILPVYFHVTGRGEWVDYNESKQGFVSPDHPFFWMNFRRTANHECLDCHTTGLKTRYDRNAKRWQTEFADPGVACEACHGPGGKHADSENAADIVHPGKLDPERALAICAQCHGPRQPLFPVLDSRHRFVPGDRYDDFYQALVVVDGRSRSGEFFADGRPNSSSFEYQALSQSRCALVGGATCLSCHAAPHEEHATDELQPDSAGDASCRRCHESVFASGTAHTHHQSPAAQSCLGCHMPKVVTGVLDSFADHALDVPNPENTLKHGVPNACALCHKNESPPALQSELLKLWPGAENRQQRRIRLADAIDERTAPRSRAALAAVISDETETPLLRGAAAVLLAQRFPAAAFTALAPLLQAREPLLRARALEGLAYARIGVGGTAVAPLADDPSPAVRQMAALVFAALGDTRAEPALRQLASDSRTRDLPQPHVLLGRLALQRGNYDEAVRELERSVDLMPYASEALVSLGGAYLRKGRLDLARDEANLALHFAPGDEGAQRLLEMIRKP